MNPTNTLESATQSSWIQAAMKSLSASSSGRILISSKLSRDKPLFRLGEDDQLATLATLRLLESRGAIRLEGSLGEKLSISLLDASALDRCMGWVRSQPPQEALAQALIHEGVPGEIAIAAAASCLNCSASPRQLARALLSASQNAESFKGSIRQFSAQHFFGDSKFLDTKSALRSRLGLDGLTAQPLLLNIHAPSSFDSFLWIENLDTFDYFCSKSNHPLLQGKALVYAQGFKGSSERAFDSKSLRIALLGDVSQASKIDRAFRHQELPAHFFGDLDWSGMSILAALRKSIPHASAWAPGYHDLADKIESGHGHSPALAGKSAQTKQDPFGDELCDERLIPLLSVSGLMLDQEAFCLD